MRKTTIQVVDQTRERVKRRRLRTSRPEEEWRQPHCNMRARDFQDGPEPGDLN